jgi:hypothetical protein
MPANLSSKYELCGSAQLSHLVSQDQQQLAHGSRKLVSARKTNTERLEQLKAKANGAIGDGRAVDLLCFRVGYRELPGKAVLETPLHDHPQRVHGRHARSAHRVETKYTEHLIGWGHRIGTRVLFRPELRFERSNDVPA